MKKVIVDLHGKNSAEKIHEQLAKCLDFPPHYGKNLDALYDCLTEISRDPCIGLFYDPNAKNAEYIEKILCVCYDAEEENEHIAIISSQLSDNV